MTSELIGIYDSRLGYYSPLQKTNATDLFAKVDGTLTPPILDVGCGVGWVSRQLPGVVGVDYSPKRIEEARRHSAGEFHCADIFEWLTACDREFGTTVMVEVLEHVDDPVRLVELARRVTSGDILATVPLDIADETHLHDWKTIAEVEGIFDPDVAVGFGPHVVLRWKGN